MRERKLNRLQGWNYSDRGGYFVTIGTRYNQNYFGEVKSGQMDLSQAGMVAQDCWKMIPIIHKSVDLDVWVVMPNHIHGIIWIRGVGTGHCPVRTKGAVGFGVGTGQCPVRTYGLLSKIINGYKNAVTKEIRRNLVVADFGWHRSFYDEISRERKSWERVRKYIVNNPKMWFRDRNKIE